MGWWLNGLQQYEHDLEWEAGPSYSWAFSVPRKETYSGMFPQAEFLLETHKLKGKGGGPGPRGVSLGGSGVGRILAGRGRLAQSHFALIRLVPPVGSGPVRGQR